MVVSLACNLDQLQEAFLERLRTEFDRAENDVGAAVSPAASAQLVLELRWVVVDEVAAFPVAVEHGTELGNDVGVSSCAIRTFHSSPVTCAECVRFDDPT